MEKQKFPKEKNGINWKIVIYFSIAVFFIALMFAIPYILFYYKSSDIEPQKKEKEACENCVRRKIDGVYVKKGKENIYPIAIVIDNHTEARPPAGLSKANLVYEVEAEGRITRYLAIFADGENVEKIGPVRSARPYFIDWLSEFNALFAHCGGSPEALVKIKKEDICDINEFYNEHYFWRDHSRPKSHDLFTSSKNMYKYVDRTDLEDEKIDYEMWSYKDESPSGATTSEIFLAYKKPYYEIKWKYDPETNDYLRYLAGEVHREENGNEIRAKNVIIQFAETEVLDKELRIRIDTTDINDAIICMDGVCREGEWKKKSATKRTRYYYENGDEVEFNTGTTWIQVVRENWDVKY